MHINNIMENRKKMYTEREYWSNRLKNVGSVNTSPASIDSVNPRESSFLVQNIKAGDIVLDYGVGGGRLFPVYNSILPIVTGWDIADFTTLIEDQREKYNKFWYKHIVSDKDIWDCNYKDEYFDVLVSLSVFTHIRHERIEKTFRELMRISKKVLLSAYDDVPLKITDDSYCFLHDYKKLFESYQVIDIFKINKFSYFTIIK